MRLAVDTNVLVSAFLWEGTPGRLIDLASDKVIEIATSQALLDELAEVLHRRKFTRQVQATGLTPAQIVPARQLAQQVSRDADDDAVLACAIAARADLIVSGDEDLLILKAH